MRGKPADAPPPRLIDIITAVVVMAAVVVLVAKTIEKVESERGFPPAVSSTSYVRPIASEAEVFRVRHTDQGVHPALEGDTAAHIRSLEMYRVLRPYPGAPPRIPHGLTDTEFRNSNCNTCHLRGGWVARFNTYAPVTPHPELSACLQCHVAQDTLVGRPLPAIGESVCQQCHIDPDLDPELFVELDWQTVPWPDTDMQAIPEGPHRIPHDFQTRSNCLACHSGPGAVIDLRTDHPERVNCRQCHVRASEETGSPSAVWDGASRSSGGAP